MCANEVSRSDQPGPQTISPTPHLCIENKARVRINPEVAVYKTSVLKRQVAIREADQVIIRAGAHYDIRGG
jgi:hypothetical protein